MFSTLMALNGNPFRAFYLLAVTNNNNKGVIGMKRWLSFLSLVIALSIVMALPLTTIAVEEEVEIEEVENVEETDVNEEEEQNNKNNGKAKGKSSSKEWKEIKSSLETEKDTLETLKDDLELEIEELEAELEAAEASEDFEAIETIQLKISMLKESFSEHKDLMKQKIREMQQVMKEKYTAEEWNLLMENASELEGISGVKMLPAENILMPGKNLKFDVPPVIKEGRVLVPIRSISTALGADVSWKVDTKIATIVYEDSVIEFDINAMKVSVNGEEIQLDVPAEIMEGRIVVPLRFIVENMGLEVEWDSETETVAITETETVEITE